MSIWRQPGDKIVDTSQYKVVGNRLDWVEGFWENNPPAQIRIRYKVLPYDLSKSFSHFDTATIKKVREGEAQRLHKILHIPHNLQLFGLSRDGTCVSSR